MILCTGILQTVAAILVTFALMVRSTPAVVCSDRTDAELMSIPLLSNVTGLMVETLSSVRGNPDAHRVDIPGHMNSIHSERYPQGRQTSCPWKYVQNVDPNRKPSLLYEARCLRRRCQGFMALGRVCLCREVHFYVNVLRRVACDSSTGFYTYEAGVERLGAGCACELMAGNEY